LDKQSQFPWVLAAVVEAVAVAEAAVAVAVAVAAEPVGVA